MSKADEMFEALGYTKDDFQYEIHYGKEYHLIVFSIEDKAFMCNQNILYYPQLISMEDLNAINEKCKELGWI